jgi:hypothetical protein
LTGRRVIPVGSIVDVTRGKVRLTTATTKRAKTQFGLFDGGAFIVTQKHSALTELTLSGGQRTTVCAGMAFHGAIAARAVRTLHSSAHGRFRTNGRYAAATVRGTEWTTSDRCDSTVVADAKGTVATRPTVVAVGPADPQVQLPPLAAGDSVEYRCARHGAPRVSRRYCVAVLSFDHTIVTQGGPVRVVDYSAQLLTDGPYLPFHICTTPPNGVETCTAYPLDPPDVTGARLGHATCTPSDGPGGYQISFQLGGVTLGAPLVYRAPAAGQARVTGCFSSIGQASVGRLARAIDGGVKSVNGYQLPTASVAFEIRIFLAPVANNSGTQVMRGVLYQDTGSGPGRLVGTTNQLAFSSKQSPGWYDMTFPQPIQLAAGNYDIGLLAGGKTQVAAFTYNRSPNSRAANLNPYANGPSNPFGPFAVDNQRWSLSMFYRVAGG